MESKKHFGSGSGSGSSLAADIFGVKEQPPASSGVFASIFPPPQSVAPGRPASEAIGGQQKKPSSNQAWSAKQGSPTNSGTTGKLPNKDEPIFREERGEPCHLSSSLYYGGQDVYSHSPGTHSSGSYPTFKKEGGEDDPNANGASRGNWWQGSLYY